MRIKNIDRELRELAKPVSVLYISSYIPRKCGLATFTKDLTNAINMLNPLKKAEIAALDSNITASIHYPNEVKFRIKENEISDYKELAYRINTDKNYDLVSLQHEYGIYGENDGEAVLEFMSLVKKPIITTLHTVLVDPSEHKKYVLEKVCHMSEIVVVMLSCAKNILNKVYKVNRNKIVVINHGVPDFPRLESEYYKRRLKLSNYIVMSSINLISPAKGIEYAICAVPKIVSEIPNFLYLVIGETHPVYLKERGGIDEYRNYLKKLVRDLNIRKNVRFIGDYISLKKLIKYIGASDIYITPYIEPQQAASGALSYAIGAGKVCISTPYLFAKEKLGKFCGIIVPFKDSNKIAEAVIKVMKNERERKLYENNSYEVGRMMTWNNIAHQYLHLFKYVQSSQN